MHVINYAPHFIPLILQYLDFCICENLKINKNFIMRDELQLMNEMSYGYESNSNMLPHWRMFKSQKIHSMRMFTLSLKQSQSESEYRTYISHLFALHVHMLGILSGNISFSISHIVRSRRQKQQRRCDGGKEGRDVCVRVQYIR